MKKFRIVKITCHDLAPYYTIEWFGGFWKIGVWLPVKDENGFLWWNYNLDVAQSAIERLRNPPVKIKSLKPSKEVVDS